MLNVLKIALRNLARYGRRTLLTSTLVTLGVVAVLLFIGGRLARTPAGPLPPPPLPPPAPAHPAPAPRPALSQRRRRPSPRPAPPGRGSPAGRNLFEQAAKRVRFARDGGRAEGGHAVARHPTRDRRDRVASVERIEALDAVHVHVDEPGQQHGAVQILL